MLKKVVKNVSYTVVCDVVLEVFLDELHCPPSAYDRQVDHVVVYDVVFEVDIDVVLEVSIVVSNVVV